MNNKPRVKRVLCFGDSNTWGYIPGTNRERYASDERWTGILQQALGEEVEIIEEGLNSRTLSTNDPRPDKLGRNGLQYLVPCLDTHDPLEGVVLMLGTNDLKRSYGFSIDQVGVMLEELITHLASYKGQSGEAQPWVLVVSPLPIRSMGDGGQYDYPGVSEKVVKIGARYRQVAEKYDCLFLDGSALGQECIGVDGVHLSKEGHAELGRLVAQVVHTF